MNTASSLQAAGSGGRRDGAGGPSTSGKKRISLVGWMIIAVVMGFLAGFALLWLKTSMGEDSALWQTIYQLLFVDITTDEGINGIGLFYDVQTLFLSALQLGIVPLVLCSLSLAIYNVQDTTKLGRIAGKSMGLFVFFYVVCALIAVGLAWIVKSAGFFNVALPTDGVADVAVAEPYNPLSIVLEIVPSNLMGAFSNNSGVLSIIFIGVVLGIIMNQMPQRSRPIIGVLHSLKYIVEAYLGFIINKIAPFAVFCMIARAFAIYGLEYLAPTGSYIVVGCALGISVYLIVFPLAVSVATRKSPLPFIKKTLRLALITAVTTSSSAGLPANAEAAEKLGCPEDISSFVLPTGMVIHMPGTVAMQIMAVTFIGTSAGFDIQWFQLLTVAAICIITAIATPTVPMAGTVLICVAMSGVGLTSDMCMLAYALVVAINYPVGMACICSNAVGDAAVNVIVSKMEGALDEEAYDA